MRNTLEPKTINKKIDSFSDFWSSNKDLFTCLFRQLEEPEKLIILLVSKSLNVLCTNLMKINKNNEINYVEVYKILAIRGNLGRIEYIDKLFSGAHYFSSIVMYYSARSGHGHIIKWINEYAYKYHNRSVYIFGALMGEQTDILLSIPTGLFTVDMDMNYLINALGVHNKLNAVSYIFHIHSTIMNYWIKDFVGLSLVYGNSDILELMESKAGKTHEEIQAMIYTTPKINRLLVDWAKKKNYVLPPDRLVDTYCKIDNTPYTTIRKHFTQQAHYEHFTRVRNHDNIYYWTYHQ